MKRRRADSSDQRQYGEGTSLEVRSTLLKLTGEFVRAARQLPGVERIALLGSIAAPGVAACART